MRSIESKDTVQKRAISINEKFMVGITLIRESVEHQEGEERISCEDDAWLCMARRVGGAVKEDGRSPRAWPQLIPESISLS